MPTPTQPLLSAIYQIQTLAAELPGIGSTPADPTETVNQYPAVVTFPTSVPSVALVNGVVRTMVILRTLIFQNRTSLPQDIASIVPYGQQFLMLLQADPTLANTVMTIDDTTGQFGPIEYGGTTTYIGWSFDITVKLEDALS